MLRRNRVDQMGKDLDSLIKRAFVDRYENPDYPPSPEVWDKIVRDLKKQSRADRRRHLRPVIVVCVSVLLLSGILVVFNKPVMAFTNRFMKTIIEVTEDTFRVHKKVIPMDDKETEDYFFGRKIAVKIRYKSHLQQFKL